MKIARHKRMSTGLLWGWIMKKILVERHPREPHVWELVDGIHGEWFELFGEGKKRLLPVLDLLPPMKQFGHFHYYELSNDEYFSVLGMTP